MLFFRSRPKTFVPRSRERDAQNDAERTKEIFSALERVEKDLERETAGLRARYEAAQTNASMCLVAIEAEGSDVPMNDRLGKLEQSVAYYEARIRELEEQLAAVRRVSAMANTTLRPASQNAA